MNLGKGIQTLKGRILSGSKLQFLKSKRGRHNPKGDFAIHVLLTLHLLIVCLIFFRESLTFSLQVLQTEVSPILLSLYLDLASDHGCTKSS